jgi:hypothetical protein
MSLLLKTGIAVCIVIVLIAALLIILVELSFTVEPLPELAQPDEGEGDYDELAGLPDQCHNDRALLL